MNWEVAIKIMIELSQISLFAVGGATSALPDIHRRVVEINGWLSDRQFSEMVGLSQAAPGPNMLLVSMIGWKLAELPGALLAFLGMCGPSSLLVFMLSRFWERCRQEKWNQTLTAALGPIAIGLTLASGYLVTLGAAVNIETGVLIAITAAVTLFTRLHPLWCVAGGAAAGAFGLL